GRLWSAELIANSFVGPPLGAWLLVGVFALPFFVDAATFAVSAALIAMISLPLTATGSRSSPAGSAVDHAVSGGGGWTADIKEGFLWLWHHEFLRSLAVILGLLNMLGTLSAASLVLFAQEELSTSPTEFAVMTIGSAVGGVVGGWTASAIARRIGSGPSLWLTLIGGAVTGIVVGFTSSWIVVAIMFGLFMLLAVLWNVITVSLRQSIIPDEILGRVNSVYRFFAWGMMPIGAMLGGILIAAVDAVGSRSVALRSPWLVAGVAHLLLLAYAGRKLTTERIEAARAGGAHGAATP
ncbi:MAG: MFS transporter, partial [Acidimicrobiales bacterium]